MLRLPGTRVPIAIVLTTLFVLILGVACVLEPTDGPAGGGGPTSDGSTPQSTPQSTETVSPEAGAAVQGNVQSLDAEAGLLTLSTADGKTVVVNVDQATAITINGETGVLADLQPGDTVEVEVDQASQTATAITVESEEAAVTARQGTVASVDAEAGLLTLALASGETLEVTADQATAITINGETGVLADLQPGDVVEVEVDQDTGLVAAITVESEGASQGEQDTVTAQQGTVASVDAETGLLTLTLESGETLEVTADQATAITINGETGVLADLQPGDAVEVEVDQETGLAAAITVPGKGASQGEQDTVTAQQGTVASVDAETGLLTLTLASGETLEVTADQATAITINGETGLLADLQPGDVVEVEVDQDTGLAAAITAQTEVATGIGQITQIDLLSQAVTVETEDQEVLHLRFLVVGDSTEVYIDGGRGSLVDVVRGASVEVTYNPETMVVTAIHIHTGVSGGAGR